MKINNIEILVSTIKKFQENHERYYIPKFDFSINICPELSYSIELEFINFLCEVSKGNFAYINNITITPDNLLKETEGLNSWVLLYYNEKFEPTNYDYSIIVKQPFVRWIIENQDLFKE